VEDESATATLLAVRDLLRASCLHAQQAVEKAMKAPLIERAAVVPRTHDLIDLRRRVMDAGWSMPLKSDAAAWLNSVYRGRYPTEDGLLPHGEPSADDARQAVETAARAVAFARAALGAALGE
jgi:HEPN domain-containing protein